MKLSTFLLLSGTSAMNLNRLHEDQVITIKMPPFFKTSDYEEDKAADDFAHADAL